MVKVNCTSFLAVDVPGEGRKVLITPFGDLGDGSFLDPVGNQRLFIDHGKQVCTGAEALSGSEYRDSSGLRDDVDSAMNRYAANKLPNSVVTTYYKDVGGKSTVRTPPARPPARRHRCAPPEPRSPRWRFCAQITCCIGRCDLNLSNYWAGAALPSLSNTREADLRGGGGAVVACAAEHGRRRLAPQACGARTGCSSSPTAARAAS